MNNYEKHNYENHNKRLEQLSKIQNEASELFRVKNADYGDSFATYGPLGVLVRLGDKISTLTSSGIDLNSSETIRHTLIDIHNYAAMAIMLIDEKKKNVRLKAYLEENTTLVDRTIDNDQLVSHVLRGDVVRFRSPSPISIDNSINNSIDKHP